MKIGSIRVRISPVSLAVVGIFTIILFAYVIVTGSWSLLVWGIPTLVLLFCIPIALNYISQQEYRDLVPIYEEQARPVRIKTINDGMLGEVVRIDGVVERVHFRYLNRPQYLVADKSGEISVKMFTSPREEIREGDVVVVLGQIIKRYVLAGDPVINCVDIRKVRPPRNK